MSLPVTIVRAQNAPSLNYETQLQTLFDALLNAPSYRNGQGELSPSQSQKAKRLLLAYTQRLKDHRLQLKNVVYRADTRVIRITFADDANQYVLKVAYKTDHDAVLSNSVYANKEQIIDIKCIYYERGELAYFRLWPENQIVTKHADAQIGGQLDSQIISKPLDYARYQVQFDLPQEQCAFCHQLAKYDHSESGLFFPRYQEHLAGKIADNKSNPATGDLFLEQSFTKTTKADLAKQGVAVPEAMANTFLFQQVDYTRDPVRANMLARTLFELPELIQTLARDNRQNYCLTVRFSSSVFSNENYVCADNEARKLYVRFSNPALVSGHPQVQYVTDFWQ